MAKKDNLKQAINKAKTAEKSAAQKIIEREIEKAEKEESKTEAKTRNTTLLLRPSVFKNAKIIATINGTSINDLVNVFLEQYVEDNKETLDKYIATFGK